MMPKYRRLRYSKRDRMIYLIDFYGPFVFVAVVVLIVLVLIFASVGGLSVQ